MGYLYLDYQQNVVEQFRADEIESTGEIALDHTEYEGRTSITLSRGFEVLTGAEFTGEIVGADTYSESWRYDWYIRDHSGNLRIIYTGPDSNNLDVLQRQTYYPYGLAVGKNLNTALENKYAYNGIEHVGEFGLQWEMATYRSLDSRGVWNSVDPKAEMLPGLSPYQSMNNNPISNVDPEGDVFQIAPILIGAAIGGGIGGIQNGWDGVWKGAITGGIGGAVGQFGGGSFLENVAWGAGEGALTGGVGSALSGGNFFDGALTGAQWGAIAAGAQSGIQATGNAFGGHGFRTNEGVINHYWKSGDFQSAMAFIQNRYNLKAMDAQTGEMGPKFTYNPDLKEFGHTNLGSGDVTIGIEGMRTIDKLKATMAHEFAHFAIDRQYDGIFWDWGPTRVKEAWNFYDGATGYNAEILNAGRMHISRKLLKSSYSNFSTIGTNWNYGTKSFVSSVPFNPSWYFKGAVKNKWFHTLPRRF